MRRHFRKYPLRAGSITLGSVATVIPFGLLAVAAADLAGWSTVTYWKAAQALLALSVMLGIMLPAVATDPDMDGYRQGWRRAWVAAQPWRRSREGGDR